MKRNSIKPIIWHHTVHPAFTLRKSILNFIQPLPSFPQSFTPTPGGYSHHFTSLLSDPGGRDDSITTVSSKSFPTLKGCYMLQVKHLHKTSRRISKKTGSPTPLSAVHWYTPACWRSTRSSVRIGPSPIRAGDEVPLVPPLWNDKTNRIIYSPHFCVSISNWRKRHFWVRTNLHISQSQLLLECANC